MQTFRNPLLLMLFVCLSFAGLAQDHQRTSNYRVSIKVNPLSMVDPNYPTVQPSVELGYKQFSLIYKYGILAPLFFQQKSSHGSYEHSEKLKGHKQKLELRYYLDHPIADNALFIALEGFWGRFEQRRWDGWFYNKKSQKFGYDYALKRTTVWGIVPKIGFIPSINQRLFLDVSCAIGPRVVHNQYLDVTNLKQEEARIGEQEWGGSFRGMQGKRVAAHLAFEANFGYRFSK